MKVCHSTTPQGEKHTDKELLTGYRPGLQRKYAKASRSAAQNLGCEVLERSAEKFARSVLRRGEGGNTLSLFDAISTKSSKGSA